MKLSALRLASAGLLTTAAFTLIALGSAPAPIEAQAAAGPTTYEIDNGHSSILFRVMHFNTAPFYGRFNQASGTITWDDANLAASGVDITIDAKSVDTNNEKRDQHLRNADFFNTEEFSNITFKSTTVKKDGDTYTITGPMFFNGTTKEVTATFEKTGEGPDPRGTQRIGGEAIFTISRSEFGVNYMPGGLGDEVRVIVALEGVKK